MIKKLVNQIDDAIGTVALIGILAITIVNVFCRFILNDSFAWAEEVSIGLFVWLVFIGVSSAMKRNGHIGVDYFVEKLPRPLKLVAIVIRAAAIYFVLLFVFVYLGYELMAQASSKLTPVLGISYQWIDLAVPVGGILTAYHFTRQLVKRNDHDSSTGESV